MKTLDVKALREGIDKTLDELKVQSKEINKIKKNVDGIVALDDALKGKGGEAIRNFYEECHTPFLRFYDLFIEEYTSALKKIKKSLESLESHDDGFISQQFLENDLEDGLNEADRETKSMVSSTNDVIKRVKHIVDLPELDDSEFDKHQKQALKEINDTLEKLNTFDREQTNELKTASNDLQTMKTYMKTLGKMYTSSGPRIEINTYKKGSILESEENISNFTLMNQLDPEKKVDTDATSAIVTMLKKLEETDYLTFDTVMRDKDEIRIHHKIHENDNPLMGPLQKGPVVYPQKLDDIRVIDGKLYNVKGWKVATDIDVPDELVTDHSDPNFIGGRYYIYENGQIVRKYKSNGKEVVEVVDSIPNSRGAASAKINDSLFEGTPLEILEYLNLGNAGRTLAKKGIKKILKNSIAKGEAKSTSKSVGKVEEKASQHSKKKTNKTTSYGKQSVPKGPYREVHGYPAKVKPGAQEKHIPGTPNYKQEVANGKHKSIFIGDNKRAQELLDKFAGKGTKLGNNKERVDFGQPIGKYYDKDTGKYVNTTRGLIHYSKNGAHIVPARP
ncbi:T7SS effector LXG polymorphic toxin [Bacillus changyiensis]|uniref:T7SS effector LXG polymorphic toxin n=1 Tax=Bacillus changyiensis TaxID=3004103 RepID=UPI0022E2408D|nr:T7SS effector LXG polymorphic toxin [Bacillus changyiensis]MDA1475259.1 T7SS effector LXG polymorphic toxin [Bacillus changyiensis]